MFALLGFFANFIIANEYLMITEYFSLNSRWTGTFLIDLAIGNVSNVIHTFATLIDSNFCFFANQIYIRRQPGSIKLGVCFVSIRQLFSIKKKENRQKDRRAWDWEDLALISANRTTCFYNKSYQDVPHRLTVRKKSCVLAKMLLIIFIYMYFIEPDSHVDQECIHTYRITLSDLRRVLVLIKNRRKTKSSTFYVSAAENILFFNVWIYIKGL